MDATLKRIKLIKSKLKDRSLFYTWFDKRASYCYELEDASEDMNWLISEVERLTMKLHDFDTPRNK